jgi:hypothetical protein
MTTCIGYPFDSGRTCNGGLNEEEINRGYICPEGCSEIYEDILQEKIDSGEYILEGDTYIPNIEPFSNLIPQMNFNQKCMIVIIILLLLIFFKDKIMKLNIVKSISKSLK